MALSRDVRFLTQNVPETMLLDMNDIFFIAFVTLSQSKLPLG